MATILMIFLRVSPKIFLWPHYSAPGARGPRFSNKCVNEIHQRDPMIPGHGLTRIRDTAIGWDGSGNLVDDFIVPSVTCAENFLEICRELFAAYGPDGPWFSGCMIRETRH